MTVNRSACTLGIERCNPRNVAEHTHCVGRHSEKSAQRLAEGIGVGYDWFTKATSDSGKASAPAWLMLALAINTGRTEHIEALAHEAGLICYRVPKGETPTEKQTADVLREFGEWLTVLSTRMSDGNICDDDIAAIETEWRQHLNVGAALMDSLKARVSRPRPQIVGTR
jgi:hypothetical protein